MPEFKPTIGLEVHAELKTRTKMFCDSLNDPDEKKPNVNVCPVCMGHPGALPVPNKQAIEHVIKVGLALGGTPSPRSKFDRKNYFYPDSPKAYQISQSGEPLMVGGALQKVKINHIHLEEDAGKLVHDDASGGTLVDYNRAGVPLMELVTEPEFHSAEEAVAFMKELQLILRYLGVSDADLERGQMRADANISISPDEKLGTRAEVKNLNSFSSVFQAINFEIKRQTAVLEGGGKVDQETRGWDEAKQKTVPQRSKEEAQDYRYFPEPDIPPFDTAVFEPEKLRASLPELPEAKRERFMREYFSRPDAAGVVPKIFIEDIKAGEYFEAVVSEADEWWNDLSSDEKKNQFKVLNQEDEINEKYIRVNTVVNYLTTDLFGLMREGGTGWDSLKISPESFAHLVVLLRKRVIGSRQAKDALREMFAKGADPEELFKGDNMMVSDDAALTEVIEKIIAAQPAAVEDYKKGKTASVQFLIGKSMAELKGRGNPAKLKELIEGILQKK